VPYDGTFTLVHVVPVEEYTTLFLTAIPYVSQAATPLIKPVLVVKVTAALSAGLLANDVVKVSVARLVLELYDTPPVAIVYVPVTPDIVKESPAAGAKYRLAITSVVPV
jgi:hypothetical protein